MHSQKLEHVSPDDIKPNPDNPRLIFREQEMNELLSSIAAVGIKVPLSIYEDRPGKYILIDGERRWRCAKRLNLKEIPVIIQPKPSRLENLLMMFNIHNVRLDWDLMPMALKLKEVQQLLVKEGKDASPKNLSGITGVSLPTVKRALELLELPEKYRKMLLREAEKPKDQQRIKPDLFVEIHKSRNVIEKYVPGFFDSISKNQYLDAMISKYLSGTINNVVKFRDVSKIARAEKVGEDASHVKPALMKLVKEKNYSIEQAYRDTVEAQYKARDFLTKAKAFLEVLNDYKTGDSFSAELKEELLRIQSKISKLLRD